jgi:hypothetical protein
MCGEHYIYIWVPRSSFIRDGEIEEGGVDRLIIVYYIPNIIKMNVHSANCIVLKIYTVEAVVYFGRFFAKLEFSRGFL